MSAIQNAKATTTTGSDEKNSPTPPASPVSAPKLKQGVEQVDMLHFEIEQTFQTLAFDTFILDAAGFTGSTPSTVMFQDLQEDDEIEVTFGVLPPLQDAVTDAVTDASNTPQPQPRN